MQSALGERPHKGNVMRLKQENRFAIESPSSWVIHEEDSDMTKIIPTIALVSFLTICAFPAYADNTQQAPNEDVKGNSSIVLIQPLIAKPRNYDCPPEPFESATELRKQGIPTEENWDFKIPCSEFSDLQTRALKGDAGAAGMLATFYLYGGPSDFDQAAYWLTISSESGNKDAMRELAKLYGMSEKPEYKLRAQFWKEQSAR